MKELIKLQHAHVNQHTIGGIKGDWKIEENHTNNALGELPGNLDQNLIFTILDFARKYELEAFNVGIDFGKKEQKRFNKSTTDRHEQTIRIMMEENERLADALDKVTRKQNNNK